MASVVSPESPETDSQEELPVRDLRALEREKLRLSRFDIVTSIFMALIWFIGAFVLMLFIMWLLTGEAAPPKLVPLIENPAGRGENPEGFERDFEPPGAEEVEELEEPTLADTIEAVTDAVSTVAASLTPADTAAVASTSGTGAGDSRPPGPPGEGEDIIPRFERWQLNYTASNKNAYAKQLDAFDIELGAFGGGAKGIDTASNLSSSPRKKHNPDPPSEKRLYFSWKTSTPLIQYDRQLLQQAGIGLSGRNIVRFIPPDTENLLANIEKTYCEGKGFVFPNQIAKTIFECKSEGAGYKWEVIDQRYRKGK